MRVLKVVRPAPAELAVAQTRNATENRRDPAPRPADRVLDLRKRARSIRSSGQPVQELAHQVAAAIIETLDLIGTVHRVLRRVLDERRTSVDARHPANIANPEAQTGPAIPCGYQRARCPSGTRMTHAQGSVRTGPPGTRPQPALHTPGLFSRTADNISELSFPSDRFQLTASRRRHCDDQGWSRT